MKNNICPYCKLDFETEEELQYHKTWYGDIEFILTTTGRGLVTNVSEKEVFTKNYLTWWKERDV